MVYTEYSIEKAKARETNKVLKYNNDINYIEHFKMIFEKEKVKLYLKEEDYISNYKVPYNEITRRIIVLIFMLTGRSSTKIKH